MRRGDSDVSDRTPEEVTGKKMIEPPLKLDTTIPEPSFMAWTTCPPLSAGLSYNGSFYNILWTPPP